MAVNYLDRLRKIAHSAVLPDTPDLIFIIKYLLENSDISEDEKKEIKFIITRPIPQWKKWRE